MSKRKLDYCGLCKRPMMFYGPVKNPKKGEKQTKEVAGPSTNPRVKRWCFGRCMGIPADLDILTWVLLDEIPKAKRKKMASWAKDYTVDIESSFNKLVRGLVKRRSS